MQTALKNHIIIMPLFFDWNWTADYQRQTAKLLCRSNRVVVYCEYRKKAFNDLLLFRTRPWMLFERHDDVFFYFPVDCIPLVRFEVVKKINGFINACLLFLFLKQNPFSSKILLWGFQPGVAWIKKNFPWKHVSLYDCVDYYSSLIPEHGAVIRKQEQYIKKTFDTMVVNSRTLYRLHHKDRQDLVIVPLGFASPEKYIRGRLTPLGVSPNKPIIGYVGAINYRIDFPFLIKLMKRNPQWNFIVWGPRQKDPQDSFRRVDYYVNVLFSLPNVIHGESYSKDEVYTVIRTFDIGIIPYDVVNPFNKFCFPTKIFEYFYCGIPVVSVLIEELRRFPRYVKIGSTVEEWEEHIKELLARPWPKTYQRQQRRLAEENSWERKVNAITKHLKIK